MDKPGREPWAGPDRAGTLIRLPAFRTTRSHTVHATLLWWPEQTKTDSDIRKGREGTNVSKWPRKQNQQDLTRPLGNECEGQRSAMALHPPQ